MTTDDGPRADTAGERAAAAPVPDAGSRASGSSAAPAAPASSPPAGGAAVPDERVLESIATPASVRRAPRIGAFVRTGVLLGAVLGWLLAILFTGTTGEGRTGAILISTAALAGFGALLAAGAAALADRRSVQAGSAAGSRRAAGPGARERPGPGPGPSADPTPRR